MAYSKGGVLGVCEVAFGGVVLSPRCVCWVWGGGGRMGWEDMSSHTVQCS